MTITCELCGKVKEGKKRFIEHHYQYLNADGTGTEKTGTLCYSCHSGIHLSARIWHHPFKELGRDYGPFEFSKRVVQLYKKRGIK